MKQSLATAFILALLVACGDFGTAATDKLGPAPDAGLDAKANDVDAADTLDRDATTSACPPASLLCESFDGAFDPAKWPKFDSADLAVSTETAEGRGRVLVSEVKGETSKQKQGARVIYDLQSQKPFVIELDVKIDEPVRNSGGSSDNFSVLRFGTDNVLVVFYVKETGGIQFNSTIKNQGGDGYTPHSLNDPRVRWGQWDHYVIKANLGSSTSLELNRRDEVLASGLVDTAGQLNEYLVLGAARNNELYDLHVEYDNVVVYPQ